MSQYTTSNYKGGQFVVSNVSQKAAVVFGVKINPGHSLNLLSINGIGEDDVKASLANGDLRTRLMNKSLEVVISTILFASADPAFITLLQSNNLKANITASSTSGATGQSNWYIDPVGGSDSNNGQSTGTALKTHAEFEKRIGHWNTVSSNVANTVLVTVMNDMPASDPINLLGVAAPGTTVFYTATPKVARSGSFTSVIAKNPAANQLFQATDSALTAADWSGDIGKRVRMANGTSAMVAAVGAAPKSALFSDFSLPLTQFLYAYPIPANQGDTYVVETQVKACIGTINMRQSDSSGGFVMFQGFDLSNSGAVTVYDTSYCAFFDCSLPGMLMKGIDYGAFLNCYSTSLFCSNSGTGIFVFGGLFTGTIPLEGGASWTWDADALVYAKDQTQLLVCEPGSDWLCGSMAIFNVKNGLQLQANSSFTVAPQTYGTGSLWGKNNDGYGVSLEANASFVYDRLSNLRVTGSQGDFILGGTVMARPFGDSTGTYGAASLCSWDNIFQPTVFNGSVMNPRNGATVAQKNVR